MSRLLLALTESVPDPHRVTEMPTRIVLKGSMLKAFQKLLPYFEILDRWEGHKPSYVLSADRMFDGDEGSWEMFVRLFFPFLAPKIRGQTIFQNVEINGVVVSYTVNEELYTREEINSLLAYLGVPEERQSEIYRELHEIHKLYNFYTRPPPTSSLSIALPPLRSGYNANLALTPNLNENNVNYNANNENNENNIENDNLNRKLSRANYRRFVGPMKSRKGKTKKLKKRTR